MKYSPRCLAAVLPFAILLAPSSAFAGPPPAEGDAPNVAPKATPKAGAKKARGPKKKAPVAMPDAAPAAPPAVETPAPAPSSAPEPAPAPASAPPVPDRGADDASGADKPDAPGPISIAPLLGYATTHANLGVGIRGGYTLPMGVYLGGSFVYHLGESVDVPLPTGGTATSSVHLFYPGVEVGYELPLGPVLLRPYAGIGVVFATSSTSGAGNDASDTHSSFALWPGVTASYVIPRSKFFVGADGRLLIATSGGDPSFGMFATGGMRF